MEITLKELLGVLIYFWSGSHRDSCIQQISANFMTSVVVRHNVNSVSCDRSIMDGIKFNLPIDTDTCMAAIFIRKVTGLPTDKNLTARHNNYTPESPQSSQFRPEPGFLRSLIMTNYSSSVHREFSENFTYSRVNRPGWKRQSRRVRFKKWSSVKSTEKKKSLKSTFAKMIFMTKIGSKFCQWFSTLLLFAADTICLNYPHITINFCRSQKLHLPLRNLKN